MTEGGGGVWKKFSLYVFYVIDLIKVTYGHNFMMFDKEPDEGPKDPKFGGKFYDVIKKWNLTKKISLIFFYDFQILAKANFWCFLKIYKWFRLQC